MMQARSSRVSASTLCSAATTSAEQSATSLSRSYKVTSDCWPIRNGSNQITVLHTDDCTTAGKSVRASFGVETNTALDDRKKDGEGKREGVRGDLGGRG